MSDLEKIKHVLGELIHRGNHRDLAPVVKSIGTDDEEEGEGTDNA
jgi:hypothetical protein